MYFTKYFDFKILANFNKNFAKLVKFSVEKFPKFSQFFSENGEKKTFTIKYVLYQLCSFLFLPSHNKLTYCGGEVEWKILRTLWTLVLEFTTTLCSMSFTQIFTLVIQKGKDTNILGLSKFWSKEVYKKPRKKELWIHLCVFGEWPP